MKRLTVRLGLREHEASKREAARTGMTLSQFLRQALREHLLTVRTKPWMRYAGMVFTGDARSSRRIDEVVD